jgi:hypothetical protein
MIIFLNDDRAYLCWLTRHRQGYVVDGRMKPKRREFSLHRATCPDIRSGSPQRHWTTGGKLKACSLDRQELEAWAADDARTLRHCSGCQPDGDQAPGDLPKQPITKLGRDVLGYVLEAALVHMEHDDAAYRLTDEDIANCLGKTPGQISHALQQLIDDGLLTVSRRPRRAGALQPRGMVFPTALAMRTLEFFHNDSDGAILAELSKLGPVRCDSGT